MEQIFRLKAVNDIKPPIRIVVKSRNQLLQVLRGAHHIRDAVEITFDGVGSVYYICAMDKFNSEIRKMILSRAATLLRDMTPRNFDKAITNNPEIPREILWLSAGNGEF